MKFVENPNYKAVEGIASKAIGLQNLAVELAEQTDNPLVIDYLVEIHRQAKQLQRLAAWLRSNIDQTNDTLQIPLGDIPAEILADGWNEL